MTSMPASRNARAIPLAPRSCPSSPGFATSTRILRSAITFHLNTEPTVEHRVWVPHAACGYRVFVSRLFHKSQQATLGEGSQRFASLSICSGLGSLILRLRLFLAAADFFAADRGRSR